MKVHLKVKVCSLAAESRIIRKLEKKQKGGSKARESLYHHRTRPVRRETRHAHLAYGFLRGRRYRQVENRNCPTYPANPTQMEKGEKVRHGPDWDRVAALVAKYGDMDKRDAAQKLTEWSAEK